MHRKFKIAQSSFILFSVLLPGLASVMLNGCGADKSEPVAVPPKDSIIYNYEIIPKRRDTVNPKPVVTYSEKVDGFSALEGFSVNVYETHETFHFAARIYNMGMLAKDTFKLPDFGLWPVVEIQKGRDSYSCIVGFRDKENVFKAYKQIYVKNGNLKIHVLQHYAVYTYLDTLKTDEKKK